MINILKEINDYFKIVLYYISRGLLDKLVLGTAKRAGKSYGIAHIIVWLMIVEGFNVLALRKNSSKLKESVYTEICNVIEQWNLTKYFKISASPSDLRITYLVYGNQIIFKGLNTGSADKQKNAASLGSFNFYTLKDKRIKPKLIAWFEEAYEFTDLDISTTIYSFPTVEKVIVFQSFNNWSSIPKIVQDLDKYVPGNREVLERTGIIYKYVNNNEHRQTLFMRTSAWVNQQNLNPETIAEFNSLKMYDEKMYETVVLGMSGMSGDLTYGSFDRGKVAVSDQEFKDILIERFGYDLDPEYYRIGVDFGRHKDLNGFVLKLCYGENQQIMYVDDCEGFTNMNAIIKQDTLDIGERLIQFILRCVDRHPLMKYRRVIVQIDSSAFGLLDIVGRQIYSDYRLDHQNSLMKDYVILIPSWKNEIMERVTMDNFLFRRNRHYMNDIRAKALMDEIESSRLNLDPHGKYFRIDGGDDLLNAWEYTNTKSDRRKQLGSNRDSLNVLGYNIDDLKKDINYEYG